MIRINLLPTKKKTGRGASRRSAGSGDGAGSGQYWAFGMLIGWLLIGGAGYWLLSMEEDAAASMRQQAAAKNRAAEQIKKDIDEEGLEASKKELEAQNAILEKVKTKRRSPVYVMYELAMILTDGREGGGPDVDEQKRRQLVTADPQADVNKTWDPTGLWLTKVEEKGGVLIIEGGARDATDISEFSRRLAVSARFGRVSHPDFERVEKRDDEQHLTWNLNVTVKRWD